MLPDENDERFRWCVYCGADCAVDEDEQEHKSDCPVSTGLWPVRAEDYHRCSHCGEVDVDACCMDCGAPFKLGDVYVLRDADTGEIARRPYVGEVVCVGCGAQVEVTAS